LFNGSFISPYGILAQQRQETINASIEQTYLIDGLDAITSDLTRYGTICIITIDEFRRAIGIGYTKDELLSLVKDMYSRSTVKDIVL